MTALFRFSRAVPIFVLFGVCAVLNPSASFPTTSVVHADEKIVYEPGIDVRIYSVAENLTAIPELIDGQTPNVHKIVKKLDLVDSAGDFAPFDDQFLTVCSGVLNVPADGEYAFQLTSDDGSRLVLDGTVLLDHDGLHGATSINVTTSLQAGAVPLRVEHFENGGGATVRLEWKRPGGDAFEILTQEFMSTPKGLVRVTAPGHKRIKRTTFGPHPGDGTPLVDIHPAYNLMTLRPEGFEPKVGGLDFLSDGRMVVSCWEPQGRVFLVEGVHGESRDGVRVKQIASGLAEPLGLAVWNDRIFVAQKQEITELIDLNGDDVIDEYRNVCDQFDVSSNFHEFTLGLVARDGHLTFNLAIAIDPGGKSTQPQVPHRGQCARVSVDGGPVEYLASGLRTPNGIGVGTGGHIFIADNQGDWLPSSTLVQLQPGAFYGCHGGVAPGVETPKETVAPVVWLPQNEIGNSPGSLTTFPSGPYQGQIALTDVTHGGIKRVALEKVNGAYQGAVFRFSQGLEGGTNRIQIRPNGSIFVGCIGSGGNWGQNGKKKYGLQRLRPNGDSAFEMLAIRAHRNGFEIEFTEPLAEYRSCDPAAIRLEMFRYERNEEYGGPKIDNRRLPVSAVSLTPDRRRVFFEVAGLKPNHIVYFKLPPSLRSKTHKALWTTEAWYTLNALPASDGRFESSQQFLLHNTLTPQEQKDGWELLWDGKEPDTVARLSQGRVPVGRLAS